MKSMHRPVSEKVAAHWLAAALVSAAWLGAEPAGSAGSFLLLDPGNPGYYQRVITAGKDLKVGKNTVIEGNVHSHREIDLDNNVVVNGDASAGEQVDGAEAVVGQVTEGVDPLPLPALPPTNELRDLADRVLTGKQTLRDEVIDDVLFVDGDVEVKGSLNGRGTLIVDGDLKVKAGSDGDSGDSDSGDSDSGDSDSGDSDSGDSDSGDSDSGDSDSGDSDSGDSDSGDSDSGDSDSGDSDSGDSDSDSRRGSKALAPNTRLSFIVLGKVDIDKDRMLRAVIRAAGDVKIDKGADFEGLILADGKVDLKKDSHYTFLALDQVAPSLALSHPADGAVLDDAQPRIEAVWTDELSGIESRSATVIVDGADRSSEAVVGPDGLVLLPAPFLADGSHTVEARVADRAGNVSTATSTFQIDTSLPSEDDFGPDLTILQPIAGSLVPFAEFEIRLRYADADPGVAINSLIVALDGVDVTATCRVETDRATCLAVGLESGAHAVTAEIKDRAGNRASQSVAFTADLSASDTIPPVLEVVAPPAGPIRDTNPQLILGFSDQGFGVEPATLTVRLDGVALSGCVTYPGWAVCPSPALDAGDHTVDATIADRAGNAATANRTFTVDPAADDPTPPELRIAAPNSPSIDRRETEIVLVYRDDESGIELGSLTVELDGVDLSSDCTIEGSLASCTASALAIGSHRIVARIANGADAESTAAFEFDVVVETEPPTLERLAPASLFVATPTPTLAYFYEDLGSGIDFDTFVVRVDGVPTADCDVELSLGSCRPGPLTEGAHTVEVEVADGVGNVVTLSETLTVDLQPDDHITPQMAIVAPAEGAVIRGASVAVQVTFEDTLSGVDIESLRIDVDGVDIDLGQCNIGGGQALCPAGGLAAGPHSLGAEIRDRAGNVGSATGSFVTVLQVPILITSPTSGFVTSAETVDIDGVFEGTIESITVAGRPGLVGDGVFTVADVPLHEGGNTLTAIARGADGSIGTATVQVVRDSEAPRVVIRSPAPGFVSSTSQIAVTGELISPSSSSTEGRPVRVWVNGQEADVEGATFVLAELPLTAGVNHIEVEAEDAAGNRDTSSVSVQVASPRLARIEPMVALEEVGRVGELLATPLVVRVVDAAGVPLAGRTLRFEVTRGDGRVVSFPEEGRLLEMVSDANGIAEVGFRLGSRVGRGNHEVTVSAAGLTGEVIFCASAEGAPPRRIVGVVGSRHTATLEGAVGSLLPDPLLVQVFDELGNPSPGVSVTFRVVAGGGSLRSAGGAGSNEGTEIVATTDVEGRASAVWILGAGSEIDGNVVEAIFPGLSENPATFLATGREVGPESATAIVGLVLDNQDQPVPGVTLSVLGHPGAAISDASGRFRLHPAPVGTGVLEAVGGTTSRPGTWPTLDFEITTVSGRDNSLGAPIRLLPLDDDGAKVVGGDEDVVLRIQGVEGAELTVFADSTTFPDGSKTGRLSITQVHGDKVPMQAPMGSNFMLAWSVQPAGVKFDPPAQISIPNLGGQAGSVVDIFSFDHDLGEFVSVGTATVSSDGRRVVSNPGSGVFKSGWHGCVPPPPPLGDACSPGGCLSCQVKNLGGLLTKQLVPNCGECEDCRGSSCVPKTIDDIVIRVNSRKGRKKVAKGSPSSYSAQAIGSCEEYAFEWIFPGGVTKTGAFVSHTFEEIGSMTVFVTATCSKPACASATQDKTQEVQVFDLELTDPPEGHEWAIDDMPQMPEMSALAQLIGLSPDPSSETTFTWNFNISSKFDMCPGTSPRSYPFESGDVEQLGSAFQPMTDRVIGGHVELTVSAEVEGAVDTDSVENITIVGTNPSKAAISAELGDDDLRRISCQESQQRQFFASANGGTNVCPVFNLPKPGQKPDGGVGIMQITYKPTEGDHWNWRTNIASAKRLLKDAEGRARNHPKNVRNDKDFQWLVTQTNAARLLVLKLPLTVNVPDFTAEQLRRGRLRCNNGCQIGAGQFGLDLHEYRLATFGGLLLLTNVDEDRLTADAVWEVVPSTERPQKGDPDYVNHVINSPITCP